MPTAKEKKTKTKKTTRKPKTFEFHSGTGRRKTAVARVWLYDKEASPVEGVVVNDKPIAEYFPSQRAEILYSRPFQIANVQGKYCASIKVHGGGTSGQLGAVIHGLARALVKRDPELRPPLKSEGLLTRDPRMVERKHYGLHKARRAHQWSKR